MTLVIFGTVLYVLVSRESCAWVLAVSFKLRKALCCLMSEWVSEWTVIQSKYGTCPWSKCCFVQPEHLPCQYQKNLALHLVNNHSTCCNQ